MPEADKIILRLQTQVRIRLMAAGAHVLSFVTGMLVALILDYVLYRIGLPSKPFIYVSF